MNNNDFDPRRSALQDLVGARLSANDPGIFSNTTSDQVLDGTADNDTLTGGRGDDTLNGLEGDDVLIGNNGRDIINGGAGDDYIADGWGTGTMDGGDGIDTLDVSHTKTGSVIDLVAGTVDWDGHSPTETAINFENVVGSNGDNTIIGSDDDNVLEGRAGNDTFIAGLGNDTLYGGSGRSTYLYNLGDGSDTIYNGADKAGPAALTGGAASGSDDVTPSLGSQKASGKGSSNDMIVFGDGITADTINVALDGADLIITLPDSEVLTLKNFDENPVETLEFADGSTMDISVFQSQDWTGRGKTWFRSGRDTHYGGEGNDYLNGRSGNDTLYGEGGNDTILGGSGKDKLFGGAGNDEIDGGSGEDEIYGDDGDDIISGGYGVDHLDGGEGNDTVDYAYSVENVDIDLDAGQSVFGSGHAEVTVNFENAIGSQGDNIITGTSGENHIDGQDGDDVIDAGAGDDRLEGGKGADTFIFGSGDGIDIIDDFDPDVDTLEIDAATGESIFIQYLDFGTLIIYGRDENGNPVDQVFLVGVGSGFVTIDDIVRPDTGFVGDDEVDVFNGTDADEEISTFGGDDIINAAGGNDYIESGDGADEVHAGTGNDTVEAGLGADIVWLDAGHDTFIDDAEIGPDGNDVVYGGEGDDVFLGAGGDDTFDGGAGNDTLKGGVGNDLFIGGAGSDIIELDFGDGIDTMSDFEGGLDLIDLSAMTGLSFADLEINDTASGVEIIYEVDGDSAAIGVLNLDGVTKADITETDFLFG